MKLVNAKTRMACDNKLNLETKTEKDLKMGNAKNKDFTRQQYIAENPDCEAWMNQSGTSRFEAVAIHKVALDWQLVHIEDHSMTLIKSQTAHRVFNKCKHEYPVLLCGRDSYGQMFAQVAAETYRNHEYKFEFMGLPQIGIDAAILTETYLRENGVGVHTNYPASNARSFYPEIAFANCDAGSLQSFAKKTREDLEAERIIKIRSVYKGFEDDTFEIVSDEIDLLQDEKTDIDNRIRKMKQKLLNSFVPSAENPESQIENDESDFWEPVDVASISNLIMMHTPKMSVMEPKVYQKTIRNLQNETNRLMHFIPASLHRFIDCNTPISELYSILDFALSLCTLNDGLRHSACPIYKVEFPNVSEDTNVLTQDYPILMKLVPVAKWESEDYNRLETTRSRTLRGTFCKGFQNAAEMVRGMIDLSMATDQRKHWSMWKAEKVLTTFVHASDLPSVDETNHGKMMDFFKDLMKTKRAISKWESEGCFETDQTHNS